MPTEPATVKNIESVLFIGGCDRSGSTLLGSMLANSATTFTTPESQFLIPLLCHYEKYKDLTRVIDELCKDWRFTLWALEDPRDRLLEKLQHKPGEHSVERLIDAILCLYREQYGKHRATIWVDHTPTHIQYVKRILHVFPNARFIHLVRDGRGVASSILPLEWGPNTVVDAAHWWAEKVGVGAAAEMRFPNQVQRILYEDLLKWPEKILRMICSFAGISYAESMMIGDSRFLPKYTKEQHALIGGALVKSKRRDWTHKLTRRQVELFEVAVGDLLEYFGYQLMYGREARPPSRAERISLKFANLWRSATGRLRWYKRRFSFDI